VQFSFVVVDFDEFEQDGLILLISADVGFSSVIWRNQSGVLWNEFKRGQFLEECGFDGRITSIWSRDGDPWLIANPRKKLVLYL
jgi:hypothetical protein